MTTPSPLFADQAINLSVTGPLIRIEFGTVHLNDQNDRKTPSLSPSHSLVMPIDGFIQSFGIFDQAMKKMIDSGLIKVRGEDGSGTPRQ